ncbi:hypothetical protein MBLNU457_5098t2 [Dothideomycetes sp. NU457]
MAPKKAAKADASAAGAGKQKGAQSINVRHILCAKHSKKEEALKKLNEGAKFDDVAREFSEDKARAGSLMPEFEKVAFELEASTTGSPKWGEAKTSEGESDSLLLSAYNK